MSALAALASTPGLVAILVALFFGPLVYIAVLKKDGTAHTRLIALIDAWRRKGPPRDTPGGEQSP
mgnify:CR=1 FL=1